MHGRPRSQTLAERAVRKVVHPMWTGALCAAGGLLAGWSGFAAGAVAATVLTTLLVHHRRSERWLWDFLGGRSPSDQLGRRVDALAGRAGLDCRVLAVVTEAGQVKGAAMHGWAWPVLAFDGELFDHLSDREVDVVSAHELGHLVHRDRLRRPLIGLAAGLAVGAVVTLAATAGWPFALLLLCVPVGAAALHRRLEYGADRVAAQTAGDADAFASALTKVERHLAHELPRDALRYPRALRPHPEPTSRRRAYRVALERAGSPAR